MYYLFHIIYPPWSEYNTVCNYTSQNTAEKYYAWIFPKRRVYLNALQMQPVSEAYVLTTCGQTIHAHTSHVFDTYILDYALQNVDSMHKRTGNSFGFNGYINQCYQSSVFHTVLFGEYFQKLVMNKAFPEARHSIHRIRWL